MNRRNQRRTNITSRMLKGISTDCTDLLEELPLSEQSIQQANRKTRMRMQVHKIPSSSTTDVSTITKDLIDSGKALFINVLGERDEEIVRPVSIEQLHQVRTTNHRDLSHYSYNGQNYQMLSKPEQSALNYLSNEITLKDAQHRIKDAIQGRQLRSRGESSQSHRLFYANNKPYSQSSNSEVDPTNPTNLEQPGCSKDILMGRKSLGLQLHRRERRLTQLSQEKDEQLAKWMQKYRQHRKLIQPPTESLEQRRASIRLQNTDKYNIGFIEYLKKKSNRKIEKDLIDRVISRRDNVVEHYQEYMMKQMTLGGRNKENVRKCFDQINNETRHLFL